MHPRIVALVVQIQIHLGFDLRAVIDDAGTRAHGQ